MTLPTIAPALLELGLEAFGSAVGLFDCSDDAEAKVIGGEEVDNG